MEPTTASLGLLFKAPHIVKAVGGMLGIIESIDSNINKLLSSDFNAGVRHLEQVKVAKKEHEFLLKEAWKRFEVALTHEKGERKAIAYLAIAFCQYHLGEKECSLKTLEELTAYDYIDKAERVGRIVSRLGLISTLIDTYYLLKSKNEFDEYIKLYSSYTFRGKS